ncbi:MAG: DUF7793 family protein [Bacteroidia bacterium]
MVIADKVALSFAELTLLKESLVLIDYFGEVRVNVNKGIEMHNAIIKLTNNNPYFVIHNFGDNYVFLSEAMRFMTSQLNSETHKILGRAYVGTNAASRLAINNLIKLYKPLVPAKLFSEIEPSVQWSEDFITPAK